MESKKRLQYLDWTKGLGILMVTYGHITSLSNPIDDWMSLFKVTVFFVVAGFILAMSGKYKERSFKEYALKQLRSLGIPYVTFSVVALIVRMIEAVIKHKSKTKILKSFILAFITMRGIHTLWFLPILFFSELIFYWVLKQDKKWMHGVLLVVPIILALVFQPIFASWYAKGIDFKFIPPHSMRMMVIVAWVLLTFLKSVIATWFLDIGFLAYKYYGHITDTAKKAMIGVVLSALTVGMAMITKKVDYNNMAFGTIPLLFFVGGATGSFGAMCIFEVLEKKISMPILNYFGRNSLILMCTQRSLMTVNLAVYLTKKIGKLPEVFCLKYVGLTLISLVIVLAVTFVIIEVINRYLPFMIGRKQA